MQGNWLPLGSRVNYCISYGLSSHSYLIGRFSLKRAKFIWPFTPSNWTIKDLLSAPGDIQRGYIRWLRTAGVALFTHLSLCSPINPLKVTVSFSFCLCLCVFVGCLSLSVCHCVSAGRLTVVPRCPHVCQWSSARVRRSACLPLCPMLMSPSARWRATCGLDSFVMSYWWLGRGEYLLTGRSKGALKF